MSTILHFVSGKETPSVSKVVEGLILALMCSVNSIVKVTKKNKWIQIVGFWLSSFIYFEHFSHIA